MIAFAAGLLVLGAALKLKGPSGGGAGPRAAASADPAPIPAGGSAFVPGEAPFPGPPSDPDVEQGPGLSERLSPFLLHGGFSFFVGMAVGLAVRAVFRVALFVVGIGLLALFALSHWGLMEPPDWSALEEKLSAKVFEADRQAAGLQNEVLLSLPSAGLAGAGLVTGFKRR